MFKDLFVISKKEFTTTQALRMQMTHTSGLTVSEVHQRMHRFGLNQFATLQKCVIFEDLINAIKTPLSLSILCLIGLMDVIKFHSFASLLFVLWGLTFIAKAIKAARFNRQVTLAQAILAEDYLVIRDGIGHRVNGTKLVPGDIIVLTAGDRLPANVCLFEDASIQLKDPAATFGNVVLAGEGLAVIVATGESMVEKPVVKPYFLKKIYGQLKEIFTSIRNLSQRKAGVATVDSVPSPSFEDTFSQFTARLAPRFQFARTAVPSKRQPLQISLKYEQPN